MPETNPVTSLATHVKKLLELEDFDEQNNYPQNLWITSLTTSLMQ